MYIYIVLIYIYIKMLVSIQGLFISNKCTYICVCKKYDMYLYTFAYGDLHSLHISIFEESFQQLPYMFSSGK